MDYFHPRKVLFSSRSVRSVRNGVIVLPWTSLLWWLSSDTGAFLRGVMSGVDPGVCVGDVTRSRKVR